MSKRAYQYQIMIQINEIAQIEDPETNPPFSRMIITNQLAPLPLKKETSIATFTKKP